MLKSLLERSTGRQRKWLRIPSILAACSMFFTLYLTSNFGFESMEAGDVIRLFVILFLATVPFDLRSSQGKTIPPVTRLDVSF
jgi:hypothetical protein